MSTSADPAGPVDCRVSRQVVSYGAGTNSTAMVCEMVRRGEPFAAVVFADTGGERPETYAHLLEFSEWLTARGPAPKSHNSEDDIDEAIDAAIAAQEQA